MFGFCYFLSTLTLTLELLSTSYSEHFKIKLGLKIKHSICVVELYCKNFQGISNSNQSRVFANPSYIGTVISFDNFPIIGTLLFNGHYLISMEAIIIILSRVGILKFSN